MGGIYPIHGTSAIFLMIFVCGRKGLHVKMQTLRRTKQIEVPGVSFY